ncbi:partial Type I restriction enzyme EcoR124II R protein, partial [Methylococcales bacterium]
FADGRKEISKFIPELETLVKGMLNPTTLLDLVRNFIVFEKSKKEDPKTGITQVETVKKLAAYHQYYAVNKAIESTIKASDKSGNKKGGVVWHTQGSGKSLSMVFYAGKLITSEAMQNPTIVVTTDRNDLDDQLFDTFASSKQLLRQEPVQARDREHLKDLLKVASGGIVFTTIQKFLPEAGKAAYDRLSNRNNIVVIADEAHRTQYGFEAKLHDERDKDTKEVIGKRIAYGFATYMRDALPNATYIGFTGTPIESTDVNTPAVFGQYVDIYDISQSVADGATVKIYYESRLAKVNLDEEGRRLIEEFDKELEEDEEVTDKQRAKAKWTKLEAIVGNQERIRNLARDIITHFEQRQAVFNGTGRSDIDVETAIKQIIVEALSSEQVIDIFDATGVMKPEISILSEEFLLEIQEMKYQNLALELLKKILNDEIRSRSRTNLVRSKALLEMLETAIKKYQNNLLSTAKIIQELIELAREIKAEDRRGAKLGLSEDDLAFYDALETNDSAVQVLGDENLRLIARKIAQKVKAYATIDWTIRESARARLMVLVRRTLNKYGYPSDKQQKAIDTVLKQAELLADYFVKRQ